MTQHVAGAVGISHQHRVLYFQELQLTIVHKMGY
jgi:hypothetical protein